MTKIQTLQQVKIKIWHALGWGRKIHPNASNFVNRPEFRIKIMVSVIINPLEILL